MNTYEQAVIRPDPEETKALALSDAIEQINIVRSRVPNAEEQAAIDVVADAAAHFVAQVVDLIPEGKEREVATNNVISSVLWAKHGIVRRRVEMGVGQPPPLPGLPEYGPKK